MQNKYNPDVLSCLANLSNDEVFTPPTIANQMLDMLPAELWSNPDAKFLDPCCKSGVFLREIAKRLIVGLESKIPDLQERLNHIYSKQLFGIAITELTSMLSRRSVYCSKYANGKYSICNEFQNESGNIVFNRTEHTWENGKCKFCGASQAEYDRDEALETHAYQFIHVDKVFNMNFDVIIGNPPYQLSDGSFGAGASPIYNFFVNQAKKLNPRFLTMIIPSRWFTGGKGLDDFRDEMLHDNHIRVIHDFFDASDCFSGVEIKGGVCYFLWNRDEPGLCDIYSHDKQQPISHSCRGLLEPDTDVFIRYNKAIPILHKVLAKKEPSFSDVVIRNPFNVATNFSAYSNVETPKSVKIYMNQKIGFVRPEQINKNKELVDLYKVFAPEAVGSGDMTTDRIKPIIGLPNTCCSGTYLILGTAVKEQIVKNIASYINTKFFHFLVGLKKITQHTSKKVYQFVPMQDFNEEWTDEKLYKKYKLTKDEIAFIESMIRPMELANE